MQVPVYSSAGIERQQGTRHQPGSQTGGSLEVEFQFGEWNNGEYQFGAYIIMEMLK